MLSKRWYRNETTPILGIVSIMMIGAVLLSVDFDPSGKTIFGQLFELAYLIFRKREHLVRLDVVDIHIYRAELLDLTTIGLGCPCRRSLHHRIDLTLHKLQLGLYR